MRQAHDDEVTYICDLKRCESTSVSEPFGLPYTWLEVSTRHLNGHLETFHFCPSHAAMVSDFVHRRV